MLIINSVDGCCYFVFMKIKPTCSSHDCIWFTSELLVSARIKDSDYLYRVGGSGIQTIDC